MNKNENYVPINNRKEAKQAMAVLKALGEPTSSSFYNKEYDENCHLYFNKIHSEWVISLSGTFEHKKITLKQLIELLVMRSCVSVGSDIKSFDGGATGFKNCEQSTDILVDNNVRRTILISKIAVKVENEKEFKALMKYYDSLGYVCQSGDSPLDLEYFTQYPITFEDNFCRLSLNVNKEYEIIPFAEFAEDKGIKLPLITSEDGFDLYEGEKYHGIGKSYGEWSYYNEYDVHEDDKEYLNRCPDEAKAFSTKQAALDWIEAQKPKQFNLSGNCKAHIDGRSIIIEFPDSTKYQMAFDDVVIMAGEIAKSVKEELNNG